MAHNHFERARKFSPSAPVDIFSSRCGRAAKICQFGISSRLLSSAGRRQNALGYLFFRSNRMSGSVARRTHFKVL